MGEAYTGKLGESELLGNTERERLGELKYRPYKTAVEIAKRVQRGSSDSESAISPSDPETPFANNLHATIAENLNLDNYEHLGYYSALGTELDRFHGVDAFFELRVVGRRDPLRVTVDLTFNPHKDEYKADIILFVDEDDLDLTDQEGNERYQALIQRSADKIASGFLRQIQASTERRVGHG
jgi:hypothetical protein